MTAHNPESNLKASEPMSNNPTTIRIDNTEYVRADSIAAPDYAAPDYKDSPVRIVVLQRGFVLVGYYTEHDENHYSLDAASVIERWGTTEGLGQLVTGPTSETRLRPCGHVEFHPLGVVLSISCDESAWADKL